jgi:hypothetical protein
MNFFFSASSFSRLFTLPVTLALLGLVPNAAPAADAPTSTAPVVYDPSLTAAQWVPLYGEEWWNHYDPTYEGWFPGGRSNLYHDTWLAKIAIKHALTNEWKIFNRDYAYDGQWFAVEWSYRATDLTDGFKQFESTLGFGRIKDGRIILWCEYFDDSVGHLQKLGLMPIYDADEPHAPWPAKAFIKIPYRP